ncbi:Type IV leader peptidase family protein [Microbacterium hydrocarbonoxydans]|uniref:Type IV leader peptidase family protein n=2 Tax=Microbacterium hydrocarbonoxydans TaxID=273678 RepID=A0A1H4KTW2_9MICO|nr:Type IV leader peptidase family protein [Microbacterium hydrocarbonoxydans]
MMDIRSLLVVAVHLVLVGIGCRLLVIDIRTHRLPDRIVLPTLAALLVLVAVDALVTGDRAPLLRAGCGLLILGGFYGALRLISREGMGGGDVKLGALLGLVLGWHGWQALAVGAASAFVLAALYAVTLMLLDRADGSTRIAFGPWMIVGAVLGILLR